MIVKSRVFGANDRFTLAGIGMGGRGRGDLRAALGFKELQVIAVCDVVDGHTGLAKSMVDKRYGNTNCASYRDYRKILARHDIDAVLIATPDHWHAVIAREAMATGKDVFCEKPETLTVREGRVLVNTARRFGRVFSGGSQRVWGDYHWFHKMIHGGRIGNVREAWVNVGGPSGPCDLSAAPLPQGIDWDLWLGPAPWRPFHPRLIKGGFRPYRDYSGGGMTDWGCHAFGGALFACGLQHTGPVEIIPPDGQSVKQLTFRFAGGVNIYHGGGWGGLLSFKGTEGMLPDPKDKKQPRAPDIYIPNYKGQDGLFGDFVHCVRTREKPFRDIEVAHRTATLCHLGNIAYWLNRRLIWDPAREELVGDTLAARWLDRPKRAPWNLT
jgi:predicted dehydrogenase